MSEINIETALEQEDTQHGKYLTFNLGNESFGLEIKFVTEIIGIQPITQVPEVPDYVKGIINLRGQIIPVIDMRLKFKKEPIDYNDRTCIIVINITEISVGLIVDNVAEVMKITDDYIAPPPDYRTGVQNKYIKGIGMVENQVKLLLDCEKLLMENEIEVIQKII
jgi:purine-binding chemotaxis protein CheW